MSAPDAVPPVTPVAASGDSRRRQWASLPPLPVVITASAPLVAGPPPVLPPLLDDRLSTKPGRSRTAVPPPVGRVEGLATVTPRHEEAPRPATPAGAPEPVRPLVHRRVRSGQLPERPAMTEAVGGYVGEPREPAVPHKAPGWLRYAPQWLTPSTPEADPLPSAPAAKPPVPLRPPPEQKLVEQPATVDAKPVPRPARRPNLGESRRLGLGAPLKHRQEGQPEEATDTVAPVAAPEPAPAPQAPAADSATGAEAEGETEGEPAPSPRPDPPPLRHPRTAEATSPNLPEPLKAPSPPTPPSTPSPSAPAKTPSPPAPKTPSAQVAPERATGRPVARPSEVPLTYRAAPGKPKPRPATAAVPADLAAALRGPHQVDVSAIPVHRGPAVSAEARSLGARAFTKGGEVFLPDEAGPVDSPRARGLLAHELVHAVQQRTLGSALPGPSTMVGRELEAEAVAAEHQHAGHASLVHPSVPRMLNQAAQAAGVQLAPLIPDAPLRAPEVLAPAAPVVVPQAPAAVAETLAAPVRQEVGEIAQASAGKVIEQWTNPALGGTGFGVPGTARDVTQALGRVSGGLPTGLGLPGGQAADAALLNLFRQAIGMGGSALGLPAGTQQPGANQLSGLTGGAGQLAGGAEALLKEMPNVVAQQVQGLLNDVSGVDMSGLVSGLGSLLGTGSTPTPTPESARPQPPASPPLETAGMRDGKGNKLSLGEAMANSFVPGLFGEKAPAAAETPESEEDEEFDLDKIDMNELTARIYDRLRSRLRLELLIDRERAGLLTDFR